MSTFGELADKAYALRAKRLALQADVDDLKHEETEIKNQLLEEMPSAGLLLAGGQVAQAKITEKEVVVLKDKMAFLKWVAEDVDGRAILAGSAINTAVVKEHLDDGETIPGIQTITLTQISTRKLS
jgi:hypothetical protein